MNLPLKTIAGWIGADAPELEGGQATGYSIDTRTLEPGDLFFALRGERSDGHEWAGRALGAGAAAAVVRRDWSGDVDPARLLRVDDPAEALRTAGREARKHWGRTVVAITGSNGKTTTKDVLAALLASARPVSKTVGNLNNELGVPLTLLRIDDEAEAAVVEMGMNHAGEIRRLARLAIPDVGVVTNVSAAHIGHFDSIEGVAAAKRELIEELSSEATAVLNADDFRVRTFAEKHDGPSVTFGESETADYRVEEIESTATGSAFRLAAKGGKAVPFETKLPGRHNVLNIAAAVAAAAVLGMSAESLRGAVAGLESPAMRGQVYERAGVRVIDDCYNANPASMTAALRLLEGEQGRRRIAVLGEMRELGAGSRSLHRETGRSAAFADRLLAVGGDARELLSGAVGAGLDPKAAEFFETAEAAGDRLRELLASGDAVLFKGSRGVGLERARDRALAADETRNG